MGKSFEELNVLLEKAKQDANNKMLECQVATNEVIRLRDEILVAVQEKYNDYIHQWVHLWITKSFNTVEHTYMYVERIFGYGREIVFVGWCINDKKDNDDFNVINFISKNVVYVKTLYSMEIMTEQDVKRMIDDRIDIIKSALDRSFSNEDISLDKQKVFDKIESDVKRKLYEY